MIIKIYTSISLKSVTEIMNFYSDDVLSDFLFSVNGYILEPRVPADRVLPML